MPVNISTPNPGNANIVLAGFMGTGKTTTGRLLSEMLNREFIDMDAEIELRQGLPINRIFAEQGERFFRKLESDMAAELAQRRNLVIAAGGGAILNSDNLAHLTATGIVICLTARPETIASRMSNATTRPLLAGADPAEVFEKINKLLQERQPAYAALPRRIATDGLAPEEVAAEIMRQYLSLSAQPGKPAD